MLTISKPLSGRRPATRRSSRQKSKTIGHNRASSPGNGKDDRRDSSDLAFSLTPCRPPSASVLSLQPCRLVFPRYCSSERKNKPTPAEWKKYEIRRGQPQNQRSRGFSGAIAGVRAECSPYSVPRSNGEVSQLQLRQHHADCEAEARCYSRCRIPHLDFSWSLRPAW